MERGIPSAARQSSTGICFIGAPCCSLLEKHTSEHLRPALG